MNPSVHPPLCILGRILPRAPQPEKFSNILDFLGKYGGLRTADQVCLCLCARLAFDGCRLLAPRWGNFCCTDWAGARANFPLLPPAPAAQVQALQTDLRPIMLRRVKEDVEKSIPPKIETIVNVELTNLQVREWGARLLPFFAEALCWRGLSWCRWRCWG